MLHVRLTFWRASCYGRVRQHAGCASRLCNHVISIPCQLCQSWLCLWLLFIEMLMISKRRWTRNRTRTLTLQPVFRIMRCWNGVMWTRPRNWAHEWLCEHALMLEDFVMTTKCTRKIRKRMPRAIFVADTRVWLVRVWTTQEGMISTSPKSSLLWVRQFYGCKWGLLIVWRFSSWEKFIMWALAQLWVLQDVSAHEHDGHHSTNWRLLPCFHIDGTQWANIWMEHPLGRYHLKWQLVGWALPNLLTLISNYVFLGDSRTALAGTLAA